MRKRISIKERLKSFGFAAQGIRSFFGEEHNAFIHLATTFSAVGLGLIVGLSPIEWIVIVLCIGLVFAAEVFNTSIEVLANHVQPKWHKDIKKVKDLAAAAVLIVAIVAGIVGLIIFVPKFF